jgi:hypothetical protein
VTVYDAIDHAGWLVSEASGWLGDDMRDALLEGLAEWKIWPTWVGDLESPDPERLLKILDDQRRRTERGDPADLGRSTRRDSANTWLG